MSFRPPFPVKLSPVDVSDNKLVGRLHSQWAEQLAELNLKGNYFSGMLPVSPTELSHLTQINVSFNKLSGSLPNYFSKFQAVQLLLLGNTI
jgi:hypothetical protein